MPGYVFLIKKMVTGFRLENLWYKVCFLEFLKGKTSFDIVLSNLKKNSKWNVYNLITDTDFKQAHIEKSSG